LHETYFWACVISRESLKRKERKGFFFFFFFKDFGVNMGIMGPGVHDSAR
jgi:hypothetical protein